MDPVGWPTIGSEQNPPWSNALDANLWRLVTAALDEALDLNEAGRQDYLRALHEQDPELHRRVLELIGSDGAEHGLVDAGAGRIRIVDKPEEGARQDEPDPLIGEHIGPWRVVRRIGEGGIGTVYLANGMTDSSSRWQR